MSFFWLKKTLAPFLFPVPITVALLVAGLGLLWSSKRQRSGRALVTFGTLLLILFAFDPTARALMHSFEGEQHAFDPGAVPPDGLGWVVVLGGGVVDDPRLPPNGQLSLPSLSRLVEGIRVLNHFPEAKLVVSGGVIFNAVSEARVMAQVARSLGVDSVRIVLEEGSLDTKDQALNLANLLDRPFALVTSASHMPRALALFRKQGLEPVPAPIDFALRRGTAGRRVTDFIPNAGSLKVSSQAWYELLGHAWVRLRGQV